MGQQEILNVLKEDEWMSAKEVSELVQMGLSATQARLQVLMKWGEIERRDRIKGCMHYKYKLNKVDEDALNQEMKGGDE